MALGSFISSKVSSSLTQVEFKHVLRLANNMEDAFDQTRGG